MKVVDLIINVECVVKVMATQLVQSLPFAGQPKPLLKPRRILKGHVGKVYSVNWAPDSRHIVSASQDGNLLIWDGLSGNKVQMVPLKSQWVMTCCFSTKGRLVASGGLDNLCTLHLVSKEPLTPSSGPAEFSDSVNEPCQVLKGHSGYLSSCQFFANDSRIVTSSGDTTLRVFDVTTGETVSELCDHTGDVMIVGISPLNENICISAGCDATAKLWDLRTGRCEQTFHGHGSDINSLSLFPSGQAFVTASDDSTCRLFDIRADRELGVYRDDNIKCGVTSVAFSHSGRLLFSGYEDYNVHVWDVLRGERVSVLSGHENRVSSLAISNDGMALCTGSWDSVLKIWA